MTSPIVIEVPALTCPPPIPTFVAAVPLPMVSVPVVEDDAAVVPGMFVTTAAAPSVVTAVNPVVVELLTVFRASGRLPVMVEVVSATVKPAPVAPPVSVPTVTRFARLVRLVLLVAASVATPVTLPLPSSAALV